MSHTKLLLHTNGVTGSTSFPDETGVHITTAENGAEVTDIVKRFGSGSLNVTIDAPARVYVQNHADFDISNNDFCVEMQLKRFTIDTRQGICGKSANDDELISTFDLFFDVDNTIKFRAYYAGGYHELQSSPLVGTLIFHHLEIDRSGTDLYLFVDGHLQDVLDVGTTTYRTTTLDMAIGTLGGYNSDYLRGYIDEFRFSDIARHTESFIPPTIEYDYYAVAPTIYMSQRTNRHVAKYYSLDTPEDPIFQDSFGTFGSPGAGTTALNFPWAVTHDDSFSMYICDHENERIVKLNQSLVYVGEYDTSITIGKPCAIMHDTLTDDLYIVGINYHVIEGDVLYMYINVERITTALSSVKFTWDILGPPLRCSSRNGEMSYKPTGIIRGDVADEFLISGIRDKIYSTIEQASSFDRATEITITKEENLSRLRGMIRHSNGSIYINNKSKITKLDSSFIDVGDSDFISKSLYGLREGLNGTLLVYNGDNQSILRYDEYLNFIEVVYQDEGSTVQTDLYDIMDFYEIAP